MEVIEERGGRANIEKKRDDGVEIEIGIGIQSRRYENYNKEQGKISFTDLKLVIILDK